MQVRVKRLHIDAKIPAYSKPGDAGLDLTAISMSRDKHDNITYGTGLAIEIPQGYVGLIYPRSSNSKTDLYLTNHVGVFGEQTRIYRGKKITPRYIWSHFGTKEVTNLFSTIEDRYFLHNAFCFYTKEHLSKYPFDEKLVGKEDRYWAIDQVELGYSFLYTPKIEINHYWTSNGATWKGLA